MKEFETNKLPCHSHSTSANWPLPGRLVWHEAQGTSGIDRSTQAPTEQKEQAKQNPKINLDDPNFDNDNFKEEKRGNIQDNLSKSIDDALKKIPDLTPEQRNKLETDFTEGLKESVLANKENIAQLIQTKAPELYKQKDNLNPGTALLWFRQILAKLNCTQLGLVHDNTDDTTKFKFYTNGKEIIFQQQDIKVQYIPKNPSSSVRAKAEKIGKNILEISGTEYFVLDEIKTQSSYQEVATAILNYKTNNNGAVIDGKTVLNNEACAQIVRTNITATEYAALLKAAHEKVGNKNYLPIIRPHDNLERVNERHTQASKTEAEQQQSRVSAEAARQLELAHKSALQVVENMRNPADKKAIAQYLREYDQKIQAEPNPQKKMAIADDLLAKLDNYYKESGITRSINSRMASMMEGGKNNQAWMEMWNQKNPTIDRIMTMVEHLSSSDGFKNLNTKVASLDKNAVRGIVYDLIADGNSKTFSSEDIIKHFKLQVPHNKSYDALLGLAAAPDAKDPHLNSLQKIYRNFVQAVEGLGNAIEALDPAQSAEYRAGDKKHEQLGEKADNSAKNLKSLIDLVQPGKSTPIEKQSDGSYFSILEKGGKRMMLKVKASWPDHLITMVDPQDGKVLSSITDSGFFNADEHVEKINAQFQSLSKTVKGLKDGDRLDSMKLQGKPTYYSLRELETLSQDVPGMPLKELLTIDSKGTDKMLDNRLTQNIQDLAKQLGILDSVKLVDTPENLRAIREGDHALINIRYKNKDLTLYFQNRGLDWEVKILPGFNQPAQNGDLAYDKTIGKSAKDAAKGLDRTLYNKHYSNVDRLEATGLTEKVAVSPAALLEVNQRLREYKQATNYPADLQLSAPQLLEVLFRTHNFEDLKKAGCIRQVEGEPNSYAIAKLPDSLANIHQNHALIELVYTIKYGNRHEAQPSRSTDVMARAADKSRESVNKNAHYEHQLKDIFAYGLTAFDSDGQKHTMQHVNTEKQDTLDGYSKDEYFNKINGKAAYNDFYNQVRTRDGQGAEIIDANKANDRLNQLYLAGLIKLRSMRGAQYNALRQQLGTSDNLHKPINLDHTINDAEKQVIRLGLLADSSEKEKAQGEALNQFKEKLVENILKLLPEQITGPDGQVLNKDQMRSTLKTLPVSILLSHSYNQDGSHSVGLHLPIVLDVFNSPHAKMVIVPGVGNEGLRLAVGVSFTSKDPAKDQKVIFYGGVSLGASTNGSIGPALGGGMDFRISKADQISNYNHYLGVRGGLGIDIGKGDAGVNLGPVYKWEIDAQQKYANSLHERFQKEGVQPYIDELKNLYQSGNQGPRIDAFANKIKADLTLSKKLNIAANDSTENTLAAFETHLATITDDFNDHFKLPLITGGEIGLSVVDGAIIASGAATGNAPVVLGGVAKWGIQVLASLNFNISSRLIMERVRRTSEKEMQLFGDINKQKQFDEEFGKLPKSAAAQKLSTSGRTSLDSTGRSKQTEMGDEIKINSSSAEIPADNLAQQLDKFNQSLTAKGIDLQVVKNPDNTLEIVMLDSKVEVNDRLLISPNLAVIRGKRIFLRDPNKLSFLYFDKQTRQYPLETSHKATMESVTTISDNRFHSNKSFPTELTVTRYADDKDNPIIEGKTGTVERYKDQSLDLATTVKLNERMEKALNKTRSQSSNPAESKPLSIEKEPVRENIKKLAQDIFKFTSKSGETFISLTNQKAKSNEGNPDLLSPDLYEFYNEYAKSKGLPEFNAAEKSILTLELSTLRYSDLMRGAKTKAEKDERLRQRLDWAKGTLQPYFENRLTELSKAGKLQLAQGESVQTRAKVLVDKAVEDLRHLNTTMPVTQLEKGTSVAVAIGVRPDLTGGRKGPKLSKGLHQMVDGSREGLQTNELDDYGYIFGKDYTDALATGQPKDDHDIALILMDQLSQLPDRKDYRAFMESNLARKLASNKGLALILGNSNYEKVVEFYEKGDTTTPTELNKFMEIVEQIRQAEQSGKNLISVDGFNGLNFQLKINTKIKSGIFQKCANYTSTIQEDIDIIPPSDQALIRLMASKGESRTTLDVKKYIESVGLTGAATSTVALDTAPAVERPQAPKAGSGNETTIDKPTEASPGAKAGGASE